MGSILWTYLLCLASFGVYALVWVYRNARGFAQLDRAAATAWALGSVAAPVACAVLYALGRRAQESLARRGGRALAPWLAPALHAAIASLLLLTPLRALWTPVWLLLPLPLLLVHAQIRRTQPSGPPVRRGRRAVEVAVVLLGLPAVGLAAYRLDEPSARLLLAPGEGGVVRGIAADYRLTLGDDSWRRVEPGTISDGDADLELMSRDRQSWIVVYAHGPDLSLDAIVDARRQLIASGESLQDFEERRFLLPVPDTLPTSLARYRVGANRLTRAEYVVLTARLAASFVEVMGYTVAPASQSERLVSLVSTLRPGAAATEPGP